MSTYDRASLLLLAAAADSKLPANERYLLHTLVMPLTADARVRAATLHKNKRLNTVAELDAVREYGFTDDVYVDAGVIRQTRSNMNEAPMLFKKRYTESPVLSLLCREEKTIARFARCVPVDRLVFVDDEEETTFRLSPVTIDVDADACL